MEEELKESEEQKKKAFALSAEALAAQDALAQHESLRPGSYVSGWDAQLQSAMDRILNREDFQYNLNGDALYRQYRDAAIRDGSAAMRDAMGTAAGLTGGYSNSYAQTAGQQAYNSHLDRLGDRIPELYKLALDQYRAGGNRLMDEYELLLGAENRDYSRYQDSLADWQQQYDRLNAAYTDRRDFDYGAYQFEVENEQWQAEFEEDLRRFELEWAAKHPKRSGGGGGGGGAKKTAATAAGSENMSAYDKALSTSVSMAKNGSSWNTISGYLNNSVNYGNITQKQMVNIAGKALDAKPKSR